jgi:hypothetical protein
MQGINYHSKTNFISYIDVPCMDEHLTSGHIHGDEYVFAAEPGTGKQKPKLIV